MLVGGFKKFFYTFLLNSNSGLMALKINRKKCISCAGCVSVCPTAALELREMQIALDSKKCTKCGICVNFCPVGALKL